ncbi:MAG: DMT family transporter [Desulfobacteraceae bacterium]|nr:DMT family transporter [Desulfobacteraceae bacterium]
MNRDVLKSDGLLLLTACIWGFAFVAQRLGMNYVGPFTFNGIRFALGGLVLIPLLIAQRKSRHLEAPQPPPVSRKIIFIGNAMAGLALFLGASFQQCGMVYTTAGNAGFITGLYVVIVPILGLFFKHKTNPGTWMGAAFAAIGLYFLSVTESFTIAPGDFLVLVSAFFWAGHVLIIGWLSPKISSSRLAVTQYAGCSILSLITASFIESITVDGLIRAAIPIFYGGTFSVGIAYTLQVVAQRRAHPAHAAILLSMEAVFAAIGGAMILGEIFTGRELLGCALMLAGMVISQLYGFFRKGRALVD